MTEEAKAKIVKTVRLGVWPDRAAEMHGIRPGTMRKERKRDAEFATAIKRAEAEAEAAVHSNILRHMDKQWTAAAWMLERRWPERWAKREVVINTTQEDATRLRADLDAIDRLDGRRAD
jgi:transposase